MKKNGERLSFGRESLFTGLFDDVAHGIGWLGSFGDPFISLGDVDGVVHTFLHGIVDTDLLDVTTVTALAAVDSNDLVKGTILGALAVKSESKHNKMGRNWVPLLRRGGKLYDEPPFAKRKMSYLVYFAFSFRKLLLSTRTDLPSRLGVWSLKLEFT